MSEKNYERGVRLSQTVNWSGHDIFEVASAAFEEANFHSFNEIFIEAWDKFKRENGYD